MDIFSAASVLVFLAAVLVVGNAAATILRATNAYIMPLGIGVIALVITVLTITLDASLDASRYAVGIVSLASLFWLRSLYANRRLLLEAALLAVAIWGALLAPALVGGSQFSSFRGNWWDHFNYLAGAESISLYRASVIRHVNEVLVGADPIVLYGRPAVAIRPAAVLVAAVFRAPRADIFAYAYAYLAILLALFGAFVAQFLAYLRRISESRAWYYVIAIGVAIGFWGQLLLDTSVWSHIAALPVLAALFFRALIPNDSDAEAMSWGRLRAHAMIFALYLAGFVIYPEATSVLAALLTLTLLISSRPLSRGLLHGAAFVIAVVIAAAIDYSGSASFFFSQVPFGLSKPAGSGSWFLYFFQPYFGYNFTDGFAAQTASLKALAQQAGPFALFRSVLQSNPMSVLLPLNVVPILLGYYAIIAALASQSILISAGVSAALTLAFVVCVVRSRESIDAGAPVRMIATFLLCFMALLLFFLFRGKIWEMGKALTFVMPLLAPILFARLLEVGRPQTHLRRLGRALTLLFVASSGYFALSRTLLAARPAGIGHPSPFPSILHVGDKTLFRYEVPDSMEKCRSVEIDEMHPNRSLYLLLSARQHTNAWFVHPFAYYGAGKMYLPPVGRVADCHLGFAPSNGAAALMRPRLTTLAGETQAKIGTQ